MATREMVAGSEQTKNTLVSSTSGSYIRPLAILTTLFFLWGFLTSLNDILVPHLKSISDFTYTKVMLVQFAFFSAYFLFSVPWSMVVNKIGYQKTMVVGLVSMSLGALLFVPAASIPSYPLLLAGLMILAAGITGLQVSANPYVLVLGKPETASSRLNLTQAFNSLGTTLAPLLGGLFILKAAPLAAEQLKQLSPQALHAYRMDQVATVKMPYIVISIALILLAVAIAIVKLPNIEQPAVNPGEKTKDSIWKHPNLLFGALGIFTYFGAEVSIGSFMVNYLGQPEIAGFSPKVAAGYVSFYWGGAMVGRFIGSAVLQKVKTGRLLAFCAVCSATLVTVSMLTSGNLAMWTMLAVGLFNSIMFPSIFALGIAELGPLTGTGSGLMSMAIVGGAIVPVICYLYILFFALKGSTPNSQRHANYLNVTKGV